MKAILMSVQPKWVEKIARGKKTIEVRKTRPKIETPFKCYIYCTKENREALWYWKGEWYYDIQFPEERPNRANGKVIGEFVCDCIDKFVVGSLACDDVEKKACLSYKEICDYFYGDNYDNTVRIGYGWHISELKIYDEPKELGEFISTVKCKKFEDYMMECDYNCRSYHAYSSLTACGMEDDSECMSNGHKPITRAPQSWCYVEDLEEL